MYLALLTSLRRKYKSLGNFHIKLGDSLPHMIGYALLHREARMHRDKAIDGSDQQAGPRDRIEYEADKFASVFLMPEKLLRTRFKHVFRACSVSK